MDSDANEDDLIGSTNVNVTDVEIGCSSLKVLKFQKVSDQMDTVTT